MKCTHLIYPVGGGGWTRESELTQRILLLERDPGLRKSIALSFQQNGIQVLEARNPAEAFEILRREILTLLILDRDSAPHCGPLIQAFRDKAAPQAGNVLLMAMERLEDGWRQQYRPDAVIYKPFDIRYLYRRVKNLIQ
jgi:DNA-binding response OmpR family regulator